MDKRLLVFPMDMAGHYLRCIQLCKRLEDSYQIKFADSVKYGEYASASGFQTFKVKKLDSATIADSVSRLDFSWISRTNIQSVLDSQIEAIVENKPDAVIGDASFSLKMAAEKTETKYVSLLNGYMTRHYSLVRKPPHNHPGYKYSGKMPPRIYEKIAHEVEYRAFKKIHRPFSQIRRERGLSKQEHFLDEFEGDINLICDLPELFPQRNLPANYDFVGPLYHTGQESEEEIHVFLGDHHPNILVSMGSTGSTERMSFLKNPIFKKYRIVISANKDSDLAESNILCRPFINNMAIMERIDAVICHGGNGTVYQALTHGIPVLCITENLEQEWNVQRIHELGLGDFIENLNVEEFPKQIDLWTRRRNDNIFTEIKASIKTFTKKPIRLRL